MITELKEVDGTPYLYLWRDEKQKKDESLTIRIGIHSNDYRSKGKNPKGMLRHLEKKIKDRNLKYFPVLQELVKERQLFSIQCKEKNEKEFEERCPPFMTAHGKVGESEYLPQISGEPAKRVSREKPQWLRYVSEETLKARKLQDAIDKEDSEKPGVLSQGLAFRLYPDDIIEGYVKAKIKYYQDYKPSDVDQEMKDTRQDPIWTGVVKGAVWSWRRKVKSQIEPIIEDGSYRTYNEGLFKELCNKEHRIQGKFAETRQKVISLLIKNNAPQWMIQCEEGEDSVLDFKDSYLSDAEREAKNNTTFNSLDQETKNAIMKIAGFSQKDIDKRNAAVGISDRLKNGSDAGSIITRRKRESLQERILDLAEIYILCNLKK